MNTTPEREANSILTDAWRWLQDHRDSDDGEGKRQQVRMILAVVLGMCRPFVSDDELRATLRAMSANVDLWDRTAHLQRTPSSESAEASPSAPRGATGSDREIALDLLARALRCAREHPRQSVAEIHALQHLLTLRDGEGMWRDQLERVLFGHDASSAPPGTPLSELISDAIWPLVQDRRAAEVLEALGEITAAVQRLLTEEPTEASDPAPPRGRLRLVPKEEPDAGEDFAMGMEGEAAYDQSCRFGHRVGNHSVYCHNRTWQEAPRKCPRTWWSGGEDRDEDCPGYARNPLLSDTEHAPEKEEEGSPCGDTQDDDEFGAR